MLALKTGAQLAARPENAGKVIGELSWPELS